MDLLQTVRKEGSRGGRSEFSWSDVQSSTHRENYLGHSLMAPVGRWQKGKDLQWYAKNQDGSDMSEQDQRKAELKKVKEREEDEMRKALGLPPIERAEANANLEPLGGVDQKVLSRAIQEATRGGQEDQDSSAVKGLGHGRSGRRDRDYDRKEDYRGSDHRHRDSDRRRDRRRSRSRSRSRSIERRRRHDDPSPSREDTRRRRYRDDRERRRSRDRDTDDRRRRRRSRSRSRPRDNDHHEHRRDERRRSHSPRRRR